MVCIELEVSSHIFWSEDGVLTAVIAYLIYKYGFAPQEVIAFMRLIRPGTSQPNWPMLCIDVRFQVWSSARSRRL